MSYGTGEILFRLFFLYRFGSYRFNGGYSVGHCLDLDRIYRLHTVHRLHTLSGVDVTYRARLFLGRSVLWSACGSSRLRSFPLFRRRSRGSRYFCGSGRFRFYLLSCRSRGIVAVIVIIGGSAHRYHLCTANRTELLIGFHFTSALSAKHIESFLRISPDSVIYNIVYHYYTVMSRKIAFSRRFL